MSQDFSDTRRQICVSFDPSARGADRNIVHVERETTIRLRRKDAFSLSLHQIGGPFVDVRRVIVSDGLVTVPVAPDFGPGTDRKMLATDRYFGLGLRIDRDDPQVMSAFRSARAGDLWIRPGFPGVCTFQEWEVDGRKVVGVLTSSVDRPGGFVVLEPSDVLHLYGYERAGIRFEELGGLVPLHAMRKILSWASGLKEVRTS